MTHDLRTQCSNSNVCVFFSTAPRRLKEWRSGPGQEILHDTKRELPRHRRQTVDAAALRIWIQPRVRSRVSSQPGRRRARERQGRTRAAAQRLLVRSLRGTDEYFICFYLSQVSLSLFFSLVCVCCVRALLALTELPATAAAVAAAAAAAAAGTSRALYM